MLLIRAPLIYDKPGCCQEPISTKENVGLDKLPKYCIMLEYTLYVELNPIRADLVK